MLTPSALRGFSSWKEQFILLASLSQNQWDRQSRGKRNWFLTISWSYSDQRLWMLLLCEPCNCLGLFSFSPSLQWGFFCSLRIRSTVMPIHCLHLQWIGNIPVALWYLNHLLSQRLPALGNVIKSLSFLSKFQTSSPFQIRLLKGKHFLCHPQCQRVWDHGRWLGFTFWFQTSAWNFLTSTSSFPCSLIVGQQQEHKWQVLLP